MLGMASMWHFTLFSTINNIMYQYKKRYKIKVRKQNSLVNMVHAYFFLPNDIKESEKYFSQNFEAVTECNRRKHFIKSRYDKKLPSLGAVYRNLTTCENWQWNATLKGLTYKSSNVCWLEEDKIQNSANFYFIQIHYVVDKLLYAWEHGRNIDMRMATDTRDTWKWHSPW